MDVKIEHKELYEQKFDPASFHKNYYMTDCPEHTVLFKTFHDIYNSDKFQGGSLLDMCCGPTIVWLASPSRKYTNITMSDFVPKNLLEVQKWLDKDPNAFDWTLRLKLCAVEEGIKDVSIIADRIRGSVKRLVLADIRKDTLPLDINQTFDVVQCSFGLDSAVVDEESFYKAIKNMGSLVKPGGALVMINIIGATEYNIGPIFLPKMPINRKLMEDALEAAGFKDLDIRIVEKVPFSRTFVYNGFIITAGFKPKD